MTASPIHRRLSPRHWKTALLLKITPVEQRSKSMYGEMSLWDAAMENGRLANRVPNEQGVLRFDNQDLFLGGFLNGFIHGEGTMFCTSSGKKKMTSFEEILKKTNLWEWRHAEDARLVRRTHSTPRGPVFFRGGLEKKSF